jgi:formylglycine-generating enzyme required for sulfatase activity
LRSAASYNPRAFLLALHLFEVMLSVCHWKGRPMKTTTGFVFVLLALCCASTGSAATIDMVTVGNPGNAPDTHYDATGFGSVGYIYQIGKYEVTAGQYTAFLNAVAKADPNGLYNTAMGDPVGSRGANIQRTGSSPDYSYSVPADWANRPVNYVSFWNAARFANWLDNGQPTGAQGPGTTEGGAYHDVGNQILFGRNAGAKFFIPTEDEWYKAAFHKNDGVTGNYWNYPTMSDATPINTLPDPGNHANFYDYYGSGTHNFTTGSPYYRTEVGAFVNSASPYGTFDQGGNVWEWSETRIGSSRGLRGGSFEESWTYLPASSRLPLEPSYLSVGVGFRVASIPEPANLTLCVMGVMTMMSWKCRK